jgi:hypothetical protein
MAKIENGGWIKIYSKFLQWEWFDCAEMVQVFVYLLLKANARERCWRGITIGRGQHITSNATMRHDLHLSEQQIRTCIKRLISTGEITTKATNKFTIVTICNYDSYQEFSCSSNEQNNEQPNIQATDEQRTNNEQTTIPIEDKNNRSIEYNNSLPIGKEPIESKTNPIPYSKIQEMWNDICVSFPKIVKLTDPRKHKIKLRLQEMAGKEKDMAKALAVLEQVFTLAEKSNFLKGDNNRGWTATFDWIIENPKNWVKIYEGNYKNKTSNETTTSNNGLEKTAAAIDLAFAMLNSDNQ